MFDASDTPNPVLRAANAPRSLSQSRILRVSSDRFEVRDARDFPNLLKEGDCVVFNDSATLPASIAMFTQSGARFEMRLIEPPNLAKQNISVLLFGDGDFHTATEHRAAPPPLSVGDVVLASSPTQTWKLTLTEKSGPLARLVCTSGDLLQLIYQVGKPIQYAHIREPLALWDVQNVFAARPWSVENPSAGRILEQRTIEALHTRGVAVANITHTAGISSTGDRELDRLLPFPERYEVSAHARSKIEHAKRRNGQIVAMGTSVVRALESAAMVWSRARAGISGTTDLRIDAKHRLRVVDSIVTGVHIDGTSHSELLESFVSSDDLAAFASRSAEQGFLTHEFGDFWWIERDGRA